MSVIKAEREQFVGANQDGEKVVCHAQSEKGEVWKVLCDWAGTNERRWQMLIVMALLESAEWNQVMVATAIRVTQGRVAQIAADAKRELPQAFAPSPRDLAGAA